MKSIVSFVAGTAFVLLASLAHAESVPVHAPSFGDALRALGDYTVPAAWAGIWNSQSNDYDCATNDLLDSYADNDTLCTGQSLTPGDGGPQYTCSGTTNDTHIDIDCNGTFEIFPGCDVNFSYSLTASRNGDTASVTGVFSQTYTPSMCATLPDECTRTEAVATRVGPEPPGCVSPVEPATWGQLKAIYRDATR